MADVGQHIEDTYTAHLKVDAQGALKGLKIFDQKISKTLRGVTTQTKKLDKTQRDAFKESDRGIKDDLNQLKELHKSNTLAEKDVLAQEKALQKRGKEVAKQQNTLKKAAKSQSKVEREQSEDLRKFAGAVENVDDEYTSLAKRLRKVSEVSSTSTQETREAIKRVKAELMSSSEQVEELKKGLKSIPIENKAHRTSVEKIIKEQEAQIEVFKKSHEELDTTLNAQVTVAGEDAAKLIAGAGRTLAEPMVAVLRGDAKEAFSTGGALVGRAIRASFIAAGRSLERKGAVSKKLGSWGERLAEKGAGMKVGAGAMGKVAGAGVGQLGGALKMLGDLGGKMGPILKMVGSMGPLLGIVGGAVGALVKLFIDADAQAKEFNRELLQSASTGEFLAKTGDNAKLAYSELEDTVNSLRKSAFNLMENMKWGTTSKDHLAFRNVLTQEGVSLKRLGDEFKRVKSEGSFAGDAADYFSRQMATTVAFTRQFGVSMQDVTQFQAEMMSELGVSFEHVTDSFTVMAKVASDSGIAMNKFFGILRGVSADLTLYNMRMETAILLLGRLGKVMSPKNAQKFLQTLMRGFKDMDVMDRVKMTLLAGQDKTKKIVEADIAKREQNLVKTIAERLGKKGEDDLVQIRKAVAEDKAGRGQTLKKMLEGVEGGGALREESLDIRRMAKTSKRGLFGLAQSIKGLSIKGSMEMTKAALMRFAPGAKTLEEATAQIGPAMMAKNLGIAEEQLEGMIKLEIATSEANQALLDQGKSQEEIDKMGDDELLAAMGMNKDEVKKLLNSQKDFASEQTSLTTSLLQRLEILIAFLMNEFYDVVIGIWDAIVSLMPGQAEARKQISGLKAARETGSKELVAAWNKSGGDVYKFRGDAIAEASKKGLSEALRKQPKTEEEAKRLDAIKEQLANAPSLTKEGLQKAMEAAKIDPQKRAKLADIVKERGRAIEVASDPKKSEKERASAREFLEASRTTYGALQSTLSPEELAATLEQIPWQIEPSKDYVKMMGELIKSLEGLSDVTKKQPTPEAEVATAFVGPLPETAKAAPPTAAAPTFVGPLPEMGGPAKATPLAPAALGIQKTQPSTVALEAKAPDKPIEVYGPPLPTDEDMVDLSREHLGSLEGIHRALRVKGIKIDRSFLKDHIGKQIETSVLDAEREALFEYWLYSAMDRGEVLQGMKEGKIESGKDLAKMAKKQALDTGKDLKGQEKDIFSEANRAAVLNNAQGGIVTSVRGNMAQVAPLPPAAPGEGWASIGPHETILPAGGAGGGAVGGGGGARRLDLNVNVTGSMGSDFNSYLRTTVTNAIYDYEKRKRLM